MLGSPGTVSKILWHFTGGPRWNKRTELQNKKPKPADAAYSALKAILKSKELRLGKKEQVNLDGVAITVMDRGREEFVDPKYRQARFNSAPVCCLADIPIIHLGYHANRYGKFAIGFHRQAIIDAGFSPVFYQVEQSKTLGMLYAAIYTLSDFCWLNVAKVLEKINEDPMISSLEGNMLARCMPFLQHHLELHSLGRIEAKKGIENLLAYVKTFTLDQFDTIYCEREWRSIAAFKFGFADVAMIVVPKRVRDVEYFDPFIEFTRTIKLPRRVPIVAWEDLVEH
jgi:Putative abortive phage resistance protein AbiGi, antitoxin